MWLIKKYEYTSYNYWINSAIKCRFLSDKTISIPCRRTEIYRAIDISFSKLSPMGIYISNAIDLGNRRREKQCVATNKTSAKIIIQTIACENLESNTDFNVSHEGDMYNLVPQNRELKQFFTLIQLEIDPNTKIAKRVVLNEKNGDITTINFYNVCL